MTPRIDAIIVSHNTATAVDACLRSLAAHPPSRPTSVTLVDNASRDGTVALVKERHPGVTVIALDRNAGFAAANNVAMRRATAPLLLLLNSDTLVPAGAIDGLAARLEATGAVAAGPRLVDGQGRPEVSFGPMLSPWNEWRQRARVRRAASDRPAARAATARLLGTEQQVDWVSGACLLVRRDAALDAGLFDERYFLYEEDVDFCAALRAHGGRVVFTPVVEVIHLRGLSVRTTGSRRSPHYDRSHLAFYEKHCPRWAPFLRLWQTLKPRRGLP